MQIVHQVRWKKVPEARRQAAVGWTSQFPNRN